MVLIRPLILGSYTMPPDTVQAGQKVIVRAYLVRCSAGLLLFDTGIGEGHQAVEQMFGPIERRSLPAALAGVGARLRDVTMIINCHFHLDHCGGNPLFPRTPIFAQRSELAAMDSLDYVLPELIDFQDAQIEVCDGPEDIAPDLRILPTPGHTPGHQSLLVDTGKGRVLIAGQAMNLASEFARAHSEADMRDGAPTQADSNVPAWMDEVRELDVQDVLFAHDTLSWTRPPSQTRVDADC